jgi:hypothetical protein
MISALKNYIITLNLFRPLEVAEVEDDHQRRSNIIATRIFLILLFVSLLGLILAITLNLQTINVTISHPTQEQYESLPNPTCSCSQSSLSYDQFFSSQPSFHQVCSSQFVSDDWIEAIYFGNNTTYFLPIDFRASAIGQFQALASFCRLTQAYVFQSLSSFGSTSFISSQVLSESVLQAKVRTFLDRFTQQTPNMFRTQIQLISDIIMGNQVINGLETSMYPSLSWETVMFKIALNVNIFQQEDGSWCWCVESLFCQGPSGLYDEFDFFTNGLQWNNFSARMIIPGFASGCMPVDALLVSTLECFFNQTCINGIVSYSTKPQQTFPAITMQSTSRFNITSNIQSIIDQLMVEDWGINVFFSKYYNACAPLSCTYSISQRHNFNYVLTTLIGLLGGLCVGLGVIVSLVVNIIRR